MILFLGIMNLLFGFLNLAYFLGGLGAFNLIVGVINLCIAWLIIFEQEQDSP